MKYLLIFTLLFFSMHAEEKQSVTLGLGPYVQTQPYKNVSPIFVPSPVIFFDNSIFYIRWSRLGVYFLGNKGDEFSWGFSLTAQPRTYGYTADDSSYLKGMDERKNTFEGGLAFSASYNDSYVETMLLTDLFERYDSWIFKTEVGSKYTIGKFKFYPSFIAIYQSANFVNYYYGVKANEARANRPQYTPNAGFQLGVQTYISYPLTKKLSVFLNLRADVLPKSAQDSPLIDTPFIYSGLASLIYTFQY